MSSKIFSIIRKKSNMNLISLFIIFTISIINAKSNSISNSNLLSFYYKPIFLTNGKCLIIKQNGIYTYSKDLKKIEQKYIFQNEFHSELSKQDIGSIFIFENILPQNITFIFIKNYLFIFSGKGEIILKNKFLSKPYLENYKILFHSNYTINNESIYYFLLYKKSNRIVIMNIFEYNYYFNLNNILFSHIIDISKVFKEKLSNLEDNFSCEFMSRINFKNKLLICFLENEHEIISRVYKIDIENKKIFLLSKKAADINLSNKTGEIKVFISEDKEKSLVCIYENFSYYNCIIYDANKNIFRGYNKYLSNCQNSIFSLNLEFLKDLKKYIFYCFNYSNELNFIELNEDLEIEKNDTNKNINIQNYIKSYISNITYNNMLPFLIKNLDYNIGAKSSYINISNRQLEDNNKQNPDEGQDGPNQNDPNEGKDDPNQNDPNEEKDDPNQNDPNEGQDGPNQNNPNEGQDDPNQNNPNEGQDGPNQNNPNEGQDGPNQSNPEGYQDDKGEKQGQKGDGDKNFDFDFEKGKTSMTKGEIRENRKNIMENYEPGKSYTMQGDGFDVKVAPMGEKEEGSTYIDFQSCEAKLREENGLNESAVLSVFQTQTTSTNEKSITNKVQYVVYDENNNELDLSVCNDEKIKINYAIRNDTALDTTKLKSFGDKGIDILNSSDPFFNDICYSYSSEGGSDIILKDRISDIYQNFSVCDSGCNYESIDTVQMTVACSCSISNDTDSDEEDDDSSLNLKDILLNLFEDSTFGVIKCFNLVFDISNKKNNIGFWLFSIIIICHIPLYIMFLLKGISPIKEFIINEMKKYHYYIDLGTPPKKKIKKITLKKFPNQNVKTRNNELTEGTDERFNVLTPKKIKYFKKSIELQIQHNNLIEHNDYSKRTETNDILSKNSNRNLNKEKGNKNIIQQYHLIQLDANNINKNKKPLESNYHLDNYEYETAIEYENRTFWRILYIIILSKDNILNTFLLKFPLESQPLRICLLLFSYTSDLALNTLFYFSDNISDKYHYSGNNLFWFTLFNNILISVISTILSIILGSILESMIDSKESIEDKFKEEEKKMREDPKYHVTNERKEEILLSVNKTLRKLKIKMVIFVIIDFIILLFFFYFTTAFCSVYQNTQTSWITDAVVSIIISFPIEIAIALVITIVYKIAIKYRCKFLYKISMFFV